MKHPAGSATRPSPAIEQHDVIVVGATPGGVACAIRCAREHLRVLLVEATDTVGGMWASGVQVFDTRYAGHRCPVLSEFVARLDDHYRRAAGDGSPDHMMARFGDPSRHGERPRFEPHVAGKLLREMLADTRGVRLLTRHRLIRVEKDGRAIRELAFQTPAPGADTVRATAAIFVDATYEADLAALAGAAFRVGREGRDEFNEPHAGVHFTTIEPIGDIGEALRRRLNLHFFNRTSRRSFPGGTGRADRAVQAYTVRLVLTDRPENRLAIPRPARYSRDRYLGILDRTPEAHRRSYPLSSHLLHGSIEHFRLGPNLPNRKMDWLGANLVGGNHEYPEATPARRAELHQAHVDHALGLLHFMQQDSAVPAGVRDHARAWGLARDEYRERGGIPPLMYVREARRLAGLHVFTEHDAARHPRHQRTPIHSDSIAFAEWPMDSHDCNPVREPGSFNDGEFILAESTLPSQIPFRALLSDAVDNLIVPVAMSATHVGWGTLRLEPVFVHTGEAAAIAAALSLRDHLPLSSLRSGVLQAALLERGVAVTYFADVDLGSDEPGIRDVQYLGARGFFAGYDVQPDRPFSEAVAGAWRQTLSRVISGEEDPDGSAARLAAQDGGNGTRPPPPGGTAVALLERHGWGSRLPPTIRHAAQAMAGAVREAESAGAAV